MYGGHKIILHTIKRAMQSQCFNPCILSCYSNHGAPFDGLKLYDYGPELGWKLLPIVVCWRIYEGRLWSLMRAIRPGMCLTLCWYSN